MDTKVIGWKRKIPDKPMCKYGLSCYQKNPEHRKKFKHPPETDNVNKEEVIKNSFDDAAVVNTPEKSPEKSETETSEDDEDNSLLIVKDTNESSHLEESVGDILKSMPKDFFDFWEFCKRVNMFNPQNAFSCIGYQLVGVYDLLSKRFPKDKKVDLSCHWRYYYDPPEFQTVIKKDGEDLFHIGYFRDEPLEKPSILASNSAAIDGRLTLMGDNIFCAMNVELMKMSSKDSKIMKLQKNLEDFASKKHYSLSVQSMKTKQRQKKVVAKTFHGLGIVVPVKNDIGYRPLPESNATLKTILKKIVSAESEDERSEKEEPLYRITSNVQFANDECDYGMSLEFGLDLFCFGDPYFHNIILAFLPLAYRLLKHHKYESIVKAHLQNRRKDGDLNTLDV